MNILYVSNYIDERYFEYIFDNSKEKPIQSIQKFNKLFVSGLKNNVEVEKITILTNACVNRSISNKLFWKGKNVVNNKVSFWYIPFLNIKIVKQFCIAVMSVFFALFWCIKNLNKKCVLISDGYFPIISTVSSIICKLFGIPVMTLYTDLPKCAASSLIDGKSLFRKIIDFIVNIGDKINIMCSDMFILLTKEMNKIVNKKNKPYIIMEGLVDSNFSFERTEKKKKAIMYAGGLYEKYGVKLLIDSFIKWNNKNYELWLCGSGDLVDYIKSLDNEKIKYFGSIPNSEVVELEKQATLLVNPRFSNEEYTKYSFPSKNMEYMVSGTPVLTTKLPGMPEEYNDYVYLIEDETIEGFIDKYNELLLKNSNKLIEKGKKAQEFVFKEKNNNIQTGKIVNKIKELHDNRIENKIIFIYLIYNLILLLLSNLNVLGLNSVSKNTYLIYTCSILMVIIGIRLLKNKKIHSTNKEEQTKNCNKIKTKFEFLICHRYFTFFLIIILLFSSTYLIRYFILAFYADKSAIRMIAFSEIYSNAYSAIFKLYILNSIVTILTYMLPILFMDKIYTKKGGKINIILILLIIIIYNLIGFSRMGILELIYAISFSFLYFSENIKINYKHVLKFLLFIILLFFFACLMIYARIDTTNINVIKIVKYQFTQIFEYFLGSFRMLDRFLKTGFEGLPLFSYGRATLAGIDEIILYPIKFFGSEVLSFNQIIAEYTQIGYSIGTNTPYYNAFYTSIMNFYMDFSIYGVIIFSFLHGLFIKYVINLYEENKNNILSKILLILVSINLLMCSFKWPYQSGNMLFLIFILIIAIKIINFKSKGNIKKNNISKKTLQ